MTRIIPRDRIGSMGQLARIDSFVEAEGPARGARRLRIVTGGGLELELHPDRSLDLGQLTIDGSPVAWMSPTGITAPGLTSNRDEEWLRTFGGGLLATCGLDTFGDPEGAFSQHGRVGSIPARIVRADVDAMNIVVEGEVRQASVHGENLLLRRRISAAPGGRSIFLTDTVTNDGFRDQPHMILYHLNLGWPLLDEGSTLEIDSERVVERGGNDLSDGRGWDEIHEPRVDGAERIFRHEFVGDQAMARVRNQSGLGLEIRFDASTMPFLHEWKMLGQQQYVLGLEPANTPTLDGRLAADRAGLLPVLAPGQSVTYSTEFRAM